MNPCSHCGYKRAPESGACPRCGFDPNEPQAELLDKPSYRAKAVAVLLAAGAVVALTLWHMVKNPGPPLPKKPLPAAVEGRRAAAPREEAAAPPTAAGGPTWVFNGQVVELKTLDAVSGVMLQFTSPRGEAYQTITDASGRYTMELPAAEGAYHLYAAHPKYGSRDFTGDLERFRKLGPKRVELADKPDAHDQPDYHLPWAGLPGQPVKRDVLLIKN